VTPFYSRGHFLPLKEVPASFNILQNQNWILALSLAGPAIQLEINASLASSTSSRLVNKSHNNYTVVMHFDVVKIASCGLFNISLGPSFISRPLMMNFPFIFS
jgi:hypothetical protein